MQNYDKKISEWRFCCWDIILQKKMFLTPTHSDDVCCDLQPLGQCKKYWPGNHQLSRLICKVMNIHTWQPGMKHDQGYHFPQFMEQFCSLIKIKLRIIGIWIGSKSSESLVLKNIFSVKEKYSLWKWYIVISH